jgi:hypothetical protein
MVGIEKPHADKYREITSDWNYDASCTLTSLPKNMKIFALDFCCTERTLHSSQESIDLLVPSGKHLKRRYLCLNCHD